MSETPKDVLVRYLKGAHDAVLWKLEGVGEYDVRRPLTPTGTNLLGLVKHLAFVHTGYFVESFGREPAVPPPWAGGQEVDHNVDLWATVDESREYIVGLYRQAWDESEQTFAGHQLDSVGSVPWWPPERRAVTLHTLLVHMIAETARHAGQMDILREGIDGATGMRPDALNLPDDGYDWQAHVARVQTAADAFR